MIKEKGRECTVFVRSEQRGADGGRQIIETKSEGRLSEREGVLCVLYTESMEKSITGVIPKVKNLLKIKSEPVRAELKKSGDVSWKVIFEQGKKDKSEYETPYGAFEIGVETKSINIERTQEKTSLQFAYALFIQGEKQADCRLEIEIV